jgi:hypothetical protein
LQIFVILQSARENLLKKRRDELMAKRLAAVRKRRAIGDDVLPELLQSADTKESDVCDVSLLFLP